MTSKRWRQIESLFEAALERAADERTEWLRRVCAADTELRLEVEQLIRAHEKSDGILEKSVNTIATDLLPKPIDDSLKERTMGPYRLVKEIGRGGMGVVHQAHDPRLDRIVALKLLPLHLRGDEQIQSRFIDEAKAASALDHPNICTIYDVGESDDGQLYITMAYYEGQMLSQKIAQGPLPFEEGLDIAVQIAAGLECAHEAGIIHRDIKPSNVAITKRGTVKILDFGVAKLERGETTTKPGAMVGTVGYMSPEQARGETVDHLTDLWSLGVVLYEMLTGQRPFGGENEPAILHGIAYEDPKPVRTVRSDLPEAIGAVIDTLLEKSPTKRYASAREIREVLETLKNAPVSFRALRPHPTKGNLPAQLTSFVGREAESWQIQTLISRVRLVTLTGPAGTGKTRLSLRAAEEVMGRFRDGAFFISLSSFTDPEMVPSAIAQVLGVPEAPAESFTEALTRVLRGKNVLLVLDNFEHVAGAARVVSELLEGCPEVRFIVTSRVPLRLSGEHEFPVPPLDLPDQGAGSDAEDLQRFSAVELFVERARAVVPGFRLSEDNAGSVVEICARLDGLPLAIELAAARTKLFSPRAMLTRLGQRLDLLRGGSRDRPARHQTLRQAIAWSYDLLDEQLQAFFRRLAVFAGGFTLEAAVDAVNAKTPLEVDVIDAVEALVDQSLLRPQSSHDGEGRFQMLETIRAFAREKLEQAAEAGDTECAHARCFLRLAESAAPTLTGPDQARWLDQLDLERDNLRAALTWAVEQEAIDIGLRLGAALWRFWLIRGHSGEGRERLERLLASPRAQARTKLRAMALHGVGTLAHNQGDNLKARTLLEESLSIWRELDDKKGIADELNNLGWVACELNDFIRGRELSEEGLALNRELGEKRGMAVALNNLGWLANYRGDYTAARSYHGTSLALRREIGDHRGVAFALTNLAWAEQLHGDYVQANELLDEAMEIFRTVNDKVLLAWLLNVRGMILHDRGEHEQAASTLEECVSLSMEGGNRSLLAWALTSLGSIRYEEGNHEAAWELLTESLSIWRGIGSVWGTARALNHLGLVARARSDHDQARSLVKKSLILRQNIEDQHGLAGCFESMARLCTEDREWRQAALFLAKAAHIREMADTPLPPRHRRDNESALERLRTAMGEEAFSRAWSEGKKIPLDQALSAENTPDQR